MKAFYIRIANFIVICYQIVKYELFSRHFVSWKSSIFGHIVCAKNSAASNVFGSTRLLNLAFFKTIGFCLKIINSYNSATFPDKNWNLIIRVDKACFLKTNRNKRSFEGFRNVLPCDIISYDNVKKNLPPLPYKGDHCNLIFLPLQRMAIFS